METKCVKDLMIPVSEYATIHQDATLYEAILTLQDYQKNVPENRQPYRAILVTDDRQHIIGKINHWGFLKALEPKYTLVNDMEKLSRVGVSSDFVKSMMDQLRLWQDNFFDVSKRVQTIKVKDVMNPITESIDENASIIEAIHRIVMWQTLSLLVLRGNQVIGILRLSDLYSEVVHYILDACKSETRL